jgi:hypothetical protein
MLMPPAAFFAAKTAATNLLPLCLPISPEKAMSPLYARETMFDIASKSPLERLSKAKTNECLWPWRSAQSPQRQAPHKNLSAPGLPRFAGKGAPAPVSFAGAPPARRFARMPQTPPPAAKRAKAQMPKIKTPRASPFFSCQALFPTWKLPTFG